MKTANAMRISSPALFRLAMITAVLAPQALSAQARAQAAPSAEVTVLEEIVVTARKREERAQDVPASLNVFSGAELASTAITKLADLQYRVPGLKLSGFPGVVAIRGVSNNVGAVSGPGSPSTAIHLDGVYIPTPRLAVAELFDIQRVEVLKGPEGTLYGRNATAGVINYLTRDSGKDTGLDGFFGYGTNSLRRAQIGLDIGADRGGIRISGAYSKDDGYTKNINQAGGRLDANDYRGMRAKGVYQFSDTFSGALTVQYVDDAGNVGTVGSNNPMSSPDLLANFGPQRTDARNINLDLPSAAHQKGLLASGVLTAHLGRVTLKSISGYVWHETQDQRDTDGSGAYFERAFFSTDSSFLSQEFQLSGEATGRFSWTSGVYYSRETRSGADRLVDLDFPFPGENDFLVVISDSRTTSAAVFGEGSFALTPNTTLLLGARYTREEVGASTEGLIVFTGPFSFPEESISANEFTPKVLLQYKPNESAMLYVSATRGFKSGGINPGPPQGTYRPERIWAYEIGSKNRLANDKVDLNVAGFIYDYTDLQLRTAVITPIGVQNPVTNAAKADVWGAELTFAARPSPKLALDFSAGYLHSKLKKFSRPGAVPGTIVDLSGIRTPLSPEWSWTGGVEYRANLGASGILTPRIEYNYQGSVIFPALVEPDLERERGVGLLNASVRYDLPGDRFYIAVSGRNLTNETRLSDRFFFEFFSDLEIYAPPRLVEGRFGFRF